MAKFERRHPANAEGPWFVDTACINCDASRQCALGLIAEGEEQSIFIRQPETPEEIVRATRAMLICPVSAIGVHGVTPHTEGVFPVELDPGIFLCGFNSPRAYGANAYFVRRSAGNFLVDAPRFVPELVRFFEAHGGLQDILLTHRDDVGDYDRYHAHFGARVWIHEADRDRAPRATHLWEGLDPTDIRDGLRVVPVPGHTRGSVVFHFEGRHLFTGDSLYWSRTLGDLAAFRAQCWYSWSAQTRSTEESLAQLSFKNIWPGHGMRYEAPAEEMRERLFRLVALMKRDDPQLRPQNSNAVW